MPHAYSRNLQSEFERRNGVPDEAERRHPPAPACRMASEISPADLHWLWPQRLPHGAVTLLVGDPGVGKSLLTAEIAARITRGDPWPIAPGAPLQPADYPGPGCVVQAATQDATDSVVLSRLTAARAKLHQILILDGARLNEAFMTMMESELRMGLRTPDRMPEPVDRPLRLPDDELTLERSLRYLNLINCLILDPITDFIAPGASITALFRSLTAIARRENVVILATAHLSKTPTHRPIYRVRGSLEYVSAARSVLLLAADTNDPQRRVLHQIKSSYGPLATPLAFHIVNPEGGMGSLPVPPSPPTDKQSLTRSPNIIWDENPAPTLPPHLLDLSLERQSALSEACQWLEAALADGPRPARNIRKESAHIGITSATLYRAKALLRIDSKKPAMDQPWSWLPPASAPPATIDEDAKTFSTRGRENLRK